MDWLLLTLLSVFVVSIANILQKVLMKDEKSDPYSYALVFQFLIAILSLPIAMVQGFQIPIINSNLVFLVIAAALWGGTAVFLFKALQVMEASEVTILSSIRVVITIIASILFLQESFNVLNVLGTILILVSILLVTNLNKGIKFNKGIFYTLVMALFSGLAIVADGFNTKNYDAASYSTIVNFLTATILLIIYPKVLKQWNNYTKPNFLKMMLPLAVFSTIQGLAYLMALAVGGNTSQVGTIRQASIIVTVILAVIFLKERDYLGRKLIAAILVTCGVVLLS